VVPLQPRRRRHKLRHLLRGRCTAYQVGQGRCVQLGRVRLVSEHVAAARHTLPADPQRTVRFERDQRLWAGEAVLPQVGMDGRGSAQTWCVRAHLHDDLAAVAQPQSVHACAEAGLEQQGVNATAETDLTPTG
jgi:hypothetical protein